MSEPESKSKSYNLLQDIRKGVDLRTGTVVLAAAFRLRFMEEVVAPIKYKHNLDARDPVREKISIDLFESIGLEVGMSPAHSRALGQLCNEQAVEVQKACFVEFDNHGLPEVMPLSSE